MSHVSQDGPRVLGRGDPPTPSLVYSTCIFCYAGLLENAAVEAFPIGRRLAFDPAKGRLWAVCGRCERWNLSPIEERWEAVEECERLYRQARARVSTGNISLSRLREGTDLVRIGEPLRPEMAAWRYGDQFGRRRKRTLATTGMVGLGALAVLGLGFATGGIASGVTWAAKILILRRLYSPGGPIPRPGGGTFSVHEVALLSPREGELVRLRLGYTEPVPLTTGPGTIERERSMEAGGEDAMKIASVILARLNHRGAPARRVSEAAGLLERVGEPGRYFTHIAGLIQQVPARQRHKASLFTTMPLHTRLALEMATHEESERAAMEGELETLRRRWEEADALAAIADEELGSPTIETRLRDLKRKFLPARADERDASGDVRPGT